MWICHNRAFLSIVAPKRSDKSAPAKSLLVRARRPKDIQALFPNAVVTTLPGRDYQFRAYIDRNTVADAIAENLRTIEYTNFKDSVDDHQLHDAYAATWHTMARMQPQRPYSNYTAPRRPPVQRQLAMGAGAHTASHAAVKPAAVKPAAALGTLAETFPDLLGDEFWNVPARKLADVKVRAIHRSSDADFRAWPGSQQNVHVWVELVNGRAVGWNENPSRGWSFPVVSLKD